MEGSVPRAVQDMDQIPGLVCETSIKIGNPPPENKADLLPAPVFPVGRRDRVAEGRAVTPPQPAGG
jgi:hypothetical protein